MVTIKDVLNSIAFILTLVLIGYGSTKGFDIVELSVYNLYFITMIITQLINLFEG